MFPEVASTVYKVLKIRTLKALSLSLSFFCKQISIINLYFVDGDKMGCYLGLKRYRSRSRGSEVFSLISFIIAFCII